MSTVFRCPDCGIALRVEALGKGNWQQGQTFAMGAAPAGAEYSRETPTANMNTVEAGVTTPLYQSLLTGAAVGAVTVILTIWQDWPRWSPAVAGVIATAITWWLLMIDTRRLLRTIETVINRDLDGDGVIGFQIEMTESLSDGRKRMAFAHFPHNCKPAHVVKFAEAARDDRLTPEGAQLSRRKFNTVRDVFIARGWADWRNREHHSQGIEPTLSGKRVFPKLIEELI